MQVFYDKYADDAHDQFQQWRRQNEEGFFINCKNLDNMMLHRTPCWHTGDSDWNAGEGFGSLTRYKKVCSTTRQELYQIEM